MGHARSKRIELWLKITDIVLLLAWALVSLHLPVSYQKTLAWVMAIAWYFGLIAVGGQNSIYLRPRRRILVSMALSLTFSTIIGIFWAGGGHDWYIIRRHRISGGAGGHGHDDAPGVLLFAATPGHASRALSPVKILPAAAGGTRPAGTDVHRAGAGGSRCAAAETPAGYPIFLAVTDSRLRESDFNVLFPLYAQIEVVDVCELYEIAAE